MAKIDDSVKKKVPELRFKGFTDEWEERKFDECFNFPVSTNSLSRGFCCKVLNLLSNKVE